MMRISRTNSLVDGSPATPRFWQGLDFSRATIDQGPSLAGYAGPFIHVPQLDDRYGGDSVHRVYPRDPAHVPVKTAQGWRWQARAT
jgi:hypothetical protein